MSGRRPAFDPSRLDDELDELLPPAPSTSPPTPSVPPSEAHPPRIDEPRKLEPVAPKPQDAGEPPQRGARGAGGRPAGLRVGDNNVGPTIAAVRIPKPLYDAVVHDLLGGLVERPSYAQIVAWTCEDHTEEVIAELTHAATTAARALRGRKLASDGVPLTLRFQQTAERASLDDVIRRAGGEAAKITRTAGVIAALRVAIKQGISAAALHVEPDDEDHGRLAVLEHATNADSDQDADDETPMNQSKTHTTTTSAKKPRLSWHVVEAREEDDLGAAVVIISSHASESAARKALARQVRKAAGGVALEVRRDEDISAYVEWDSDLGRGVVHQGSPSQ